MQYLFMKLKTAKDLVFEKDILWLWYLLMTLHA